MGEKKKGGGALFGAAFLMATQLLDRAFLHRQQNSQVSMQLVLDLLF